MDDSGTQITNTNMQTQTTSPFAPVDIPDLNSIAAGAAMPPMGVMSAPNTVPNDAPAMPQSLNTEEMPVQNVRSISGTDADNAAMQAMQQSQNVQAPQNSEAASVADGGISMSDIPEPRLQPEKEETNAEQAATPAANAASVTPKTTAAKTGTAAGGVAKAAEKAAQKSAATTTTKSATSTAGAKKDMLSDVEVASSSLPKEVVKSASNGLTIEPLLEECINRNASDLHLQAGLQPILRMDGTLQPMTTYPVLDNEMVQELVFSTLDEDQQKILMKDKEFDYSFAFGDLGRFRVNAFHEKGNMAAAFRLIPNMIKSIEELGMPPVVSTFADRPNGLVLVTGPTGSGKSTTLAALIDRVNTEKALHIITIEDPIEFTHQSKRSVVAQREVHYDTYSFAAALRSILREDPDVVLIGEMRDLETIQAAITVAETGHLVFATLHTNSAAQSIDRMIDVFPAHQQPQIRAQLANILVGICSQRLVPSINGGRIAIAEVLISNSAVRNIIREGKTHQLDMAIQTGADQGMQTMDRELAKYVRGGVVNYDVAREYAVDPTEFDRLARG